MRGLVLEGGGMRGVYTAGVLDFFLDKDIEFDNVYGVSAGAANACSYLSKQRGRALRVDIDYLEDKNYASIYSLVKTGDFFGAKMCYDTIPNKLNLFDYDTYNSFQGNFYATVTNCKTGKAEYKKVKDLKKDIAFVRASCSLPLMAREVAIGDIPYLDGGVSDSIPILKARKDGNKKNVIILTRDKTYRKKKNELLFLLSIRYKKYPEFVKAMARRHIVYNKTLKYIDKLEDAGKAFVIRPKRPVSIGRLEKDKDKLLALYNEGYEDAKENYEKLKEYLEK